MYEVSDISFAYPTTAFLFYDFFLTIPMEVQKIWSRRFSLVALLYYLNRYVPIAGYMIILAFMFSPGIWTPRVCNLLLSNDTLLSYGLLAVRASPSYLLPGLMLELGVRDLLPF